MPQACRPMCNANFTTICSAASWPMAFCGSAVTRARKSCCCPSVASGAGFVRRVRAGRMAQTAAHLVECVIPWVPTRQWVVSVPMPLRYWMSSSKERLAEDTNGDLVYTFTTPWSDGTTGITLSPVELLEKLAALVPLPRVHLVRYGGCLAPHSSRRGAVTPTLRQQGVEEDDATTESPRWSWARLLKRVFALDMATCPLCRQGSLRIIAAITQAEASRKILRHLKLAADPPPIAPARAHQETFDWVASCSPRNVRLGRLSPRHRAWPQERRARSGGVSHPSERLRFLLLSR